LGGGVFGCAQARLAQPLSACSADADCGVVAFGTIPCGDEQSAPRCAVALRADQAGVYQDQVANEALRFCASDDPEACFVAGLGCNRDEATMLVAFCDAGLCVLGWNPDAGEPHI